MRRRIALATALIVLAGAATAFPAQAQLSASPVGSTWLGLGYNQDPLYVGTDSPVMTSSISPELLTRTTLPAPGVGKPAAADSSRA